MQTVDFTTLAATCAELRQGWIPSRFENAYQRDRHTVSLALRTFSGRGWLTLCWHPQAARLCIEDAPPRVPDTFTFSQQLRHQLGGLALVAIEAIAPWERAVDLQFAKRPGDPVLWHLYVEVMGKYSNVILTNQHNQVVTAAHQVGEKQSSVRAIQTGQPYEPPPSLSEAIPAQTESLEVWRERVALVPGKLWRNLLTTYRGVSPVLARSMAHRVNLDPNQLTAELEPQEWAALFQVWQEWLHLLKTEAFQPGWRSQGYTVTGWDRVEPVESVQILLKRYYIDQLNTQEFAQLHHQLTQRVAGAAKKLKLRVDDFERRLKLSDQADELRQQADLLMAYLQKWEPGMQAIALPSFETGETVKIPLDPTKNAVQNAQALYKRHQKMRRSRDSITPLLKAARSELHYLEQVEAAIAQSDTYREPDDLATLEEIQDELDQQGYTSRNQGRSSERSGETDFRRYRSPSDFEIVVGRNNRQNDELTFRLATEYDLWFHTQEIPGSHVLLRLPPGQVADQADLQCAANWAAHHSRARQGEQAPVVYTEPKNVYKPKGAKPGMVIYKHETIIWGYPQQVDSEKRPSE